MKIIKGGSGGKELVCTAEELKAVNAFAKAELSAEDVYIFSVLLCDNEIDRDHERFSEATLRKLGELFVGVTGICDHDWRSDNQVARIYRTELVTDKNRKNSLGADYVYLKGYAYMLRTEANAELIAQIDGGIKRETSVGCSVARSVCSVCGEELGTCAHVKGRTYGGKECYAILEGAVDAYEWSFVAVPAQRGAGVIKSFVETEEGKRFAPEYERLEKAAKLGEKYLDGLRSEVLRLCLVCDKSLHSALSKSVATLDEAALLEMKSAFEARSAELYPHVTQLPGKGEVTKFDGDEYII